MGATGPFCGPYSSWVELPSSSPCRSLSPIYRDFADVSCGLYERKKAPTPATAEVGVRYTVIQFLGAARGGVSPLDDGRIGRRSNPFTLWLVYTFLAKSRLIHPLPLLSLPQRVAPFPAVSDTMV